MTGPRPEPTRRRVVESHHVASRAFALGGGFIVAAALWSAWVSTRGGSWWGPIHAFLAGAVLLAISGATQLFTVTWSAAPPPQAVAAAVQRWAVAVGVALVLVGGTAGRPWVLVVGAASVVIGLVALATILVRTVRRSLLRRFDLSSRYYLVALAPGIVGVGLGGSMGAGVVGDRLDLVRLIHYHLNLVGLVGFVIVGTLPTILPTFAHHRVVSGREVRWAWWPATGSVIAFVSGLVWGEMALGVGSLLAASALVVVLGGIVARLGRRGLRGGLAYLQVVAGCLWLAVWAIVDGVALIRSTSLDRSWIGAAVVAGVGQVLLGALAYLLPVLAGRPPRLGRNLARTHRRPWLPLVLGNAAGLGFLVAPSLAVAATGAWIVDFASRLARLEWGGRR